MARGLENNNPGNIRQSKVRYKGEVRPSRDPAFKQFESMPWAFDVLAGKVIRIGHMGNNATFYNVRDVFHALDGTLRKLGVPLTGSMEEIFCENMK